ncbi:sensor histidine kinase [Microbacterium sp. HJ5]
MFDVLISVLLLGSAFLPFDMPGQTAPSISSLPWLVAACAILFVRRRWPIPVLIASVAIFAAAATAGVVSPALALPPALCVYQVAATSPRRTTIIATIATAVLLPVLSFTVLPRELLQLDLFISAQAIQLAAVVAFAGAFGDAAQSRRATLAAYEERARRAEETKDAEARSRVAEDRLRIAQDLHDLIAHQIAVINLHSSVASQALHQRPSDAEASLAVIRAASRTVLSEIGDLLSTLRGSSPAEVSRPVTPSLGDMEELLTRFRVDGLEVRSELIGDPAVLTGFADVVASQVLQEALTNALKHSRFQRCALSITVDDQHLAIVVDNPVDPDRVQRVASGHGITGMKERLAVVGGSLHIEHRRDYFRLEARIPTNQESTSR